MERNSFKSFKFSTTKEIMDLECLSLNSMEGTEAGRPQKSKSHMLRRRFSSLSLSCEKKEVSVSTNSHYNIKDDYDIVETLGMGTYSYVRHGISKDDGRHVAIKTSRGNNSCKMLRKEYDLLKRLADDNIIKVFDLTEDEGKNE